MMEIFTKAVTGTGADINVDIGFKPSYVKVINRTALGTNADQVLEWFEGMGNDNAIAWSRADVNLVDVVVPVVFESAQTGLAADSTGVQFTSQNIVPPLATYESVAIEATWTASNTDSVTDIELYDETAATVLANLSGNTGTDSKSAYVAPTAGNSLVARVNVTTASATTGATTDVNKALVYFKVTPQQHHLTNKTSGGITVIETSSVQSTDPVTFTGSYGIQIPAAFQNSGDELYVLASRN